MAIDAALEQAYNVRAATPGAAEKVAALAERGATARAHMAALGWCDASTVHYGPGARETIDMFVPDGRFPGPRSCLFFIHGGYWRSLTKDDYSWVAVPFVERGHSVAIIDYDLCPDVSITHIARQVHAAYTWLTQPDQLHDLAINDDLISVAGHSAGGHLAVTALLTEIAGPLPAVRPASVTSISGLFDLLPLLQTSINDDLHLTSDEARSVSPLHHLSTLSAPLNLCVGSAEPAGFSAQHKAMVASASSCINAGVSDFFVPGADHFDACDALADPTSLVFKAACPAHFGPH